jgi:hypothetical protein
MFFIPNASLFKIRIEDFSFCFKTRDKLISTTQKTFLCTTKSIQLNIESTNTHIQIWVNKPRLITKWNSFTFGFNNNYET